MITYQNYGEHIREQEVATFFVERMMFRLGEAKKGDKKSESKLINRLCDVRASIDNLSKVPQNLREMILMTTRYLMSIGRKVDLRPEQTDPKLWVSARGGQPRDESFEIKKVELPHTLGTVFRMIGKDLGKRLRQANGQ